MNALQARKFVLRILHCIHVGGLPDDRRSTMAYIESSYVVSDDEKEAIKEQVEQLCPKEES